MLRQMVAVATIAVLLACPVMCITGAGQGGGGEAPRCCGRCHSVPAEEPSQPAAPDGGTCCLCKGALTDRAATLPALDGGLAVTLASPANRLPLDVAPLRACGTCEDAGSLPLAGRMLRLELCALTC